MAFRAHPLHLLVVQTGGDRHAPVAQTDEQLASLLISRLEGEPLPLESDLVDACDPGRFLLKAARRNTEESDDTT